MSKSFLVVLGLAIPLAGCATGKAEVPDGVKRYTGGDCACHAGGLGSMTVVTQVNKTVAGATVGAVKSSAYAVTNTFCDPAQNILYAPVAIVESYDPVANAWTAAPNLSVARSGLGVAASPDGRLYAVGGSGGGNVVEVATIR